MIGAKKRTQTNPFSRRTNSKRTQLLGQRTQFVRHRTRLWSLFVLPWQDSRAVGEPETPFPPHFAGIINHMETITGKFKLVVYILAVGAAMLCAVPAICQTQPITGTVATEK